MAFVNEAPENPVFPAKMADACGRQNKDSLRYQILMPGTCKCYLMVVHGMCSKVFAIVFDTRD